MKLYIVCKFSTEIYRINFVTVKIGEYTSRPVCLVYY